MGVSVGGGVGSADPGCVGSVPMIHAKTEFGEFFCVDGDCIGRTIIQGEFWDACNRPYMDVLQPGDVFVDVGANIGFYPVYLGRRGIQCWAFEPAHDVFDVMLQNYSVNGISTEHAYCV